MSKATWVIEDRVTSAQGAGEVTGDVRTVEEYGAALMTIDVTAVSGTSPTLDIVLQVGGFTARLAKHPSVTVTQITAIGKVNYLISALAAKYLNTVRTVGGSDTPTVTYTIDITVKT